MSNLIDAVRNRLNPGYLDELKEIVDKYINEPWFEKAAIAYKTHVGFSSKETIRSPKDFFFRWTHDDSPLKPEVKGPELVMEAIEEKTEDVPYPCERSVVPPEMEGILEKIEEAPKSDPIKPHYNPNNKRQYNMGHNNKKYHKN